MTGQINESSFFFIQMSDQQFGMYSGNGDLIQETDLYEKAVSHVNRLSPVFILNTGDLVNSPGDESQLLEAMRITRKLDERIPVYSIPGNHDVADEPTESSLEWYRKRIGKDWYSFDFGGWHFVGLNSCLIADGDYVSQEVQKQWDWLNRDLEQSGAHGKSQTIVFMHHPLFLKEPDEGDDYFNIPRVKRRPYLELFRKHGVNTVLCGHLHQNNLSSDSMLEVVTTGPIGMPLGEDPSGFRIVKVYADHIEHKYFGLEEVISEDF